MRSGGVRLVQHRLHLLGKSREEGGDAEGTHPPPLGVALLRSGDVTREVFHGRSVLARQPVGLGLAPGFVDEDAGVGGQAREGEDAPLVDGHDLADGPRILEPEIKGYARARAGRENGDCEVRNQCWDPNRGLSS